ncbi:MAG: ATP synthase F1 subunit epsilon [Chloroflexi bacterium 44-23]|nr:MAG: ATP synthase F1 subunit epsilon [Chloroflexi bacterium 44-23]
MPIRCEIVSQDRMVFSGEVSMVVVPGADGVMGILPNHAPLLSTLAFGVVTVVVNNEREYFTVAGGIVEVQPDQVTILADAAENVEEIDVARAETAKSKAENMLEEQYLLNLEEIETLRTSLRKSSLRLDAIRKYRKGKDMQRFRG